MDLYQIRNELKKKSIYDLPLRVTFYARVSSESDAQLNSLDNQISYYQDLIQKNINWTYIEGYIDEGISAATTKNRESFHQLIDDAKKDMFDFVITKEITRFARNTLDSITYTRELLKYNVGVLFQNDGINTFDEDSELRLTIMSGIAQDELRKLSSRIKFGHQEAIKKNVVLGNSRIFGYIKNNGKLIIDENEAKMVKELFELYSTNQYSMKQIEKIFWDKGYRNHNGNKIAHSTMSGIISNPKYKGYYVGNKVKVVDIFTKKQKFLSPDEWVMFKDETGEIVPAIIDENIWDRANEILIQRSSDVKHRQNKCNHDNLVTGKLFCTHCGRYYYRKDSHYKGNTVSRWVCSGKINNGAESCLSFAIVENELVNIIVSIFKNNSSDINKYIDEYIKIFKSTFMHQNNSELTKYEKIIDIAKRKQDKLLEYNINNQITDRDFLRLNEQCSLEIQEATIQKNKLLKLSNEKESFCQRLNKIKETLVYLNSHIEEAIITKPFINQYIDKIFVTPIDKQTAEIKIKLCTGGTYSENFSRSGHTIKKICPVLPMTFNRNSRTMVSYSYNITYLVSLTF